MAPQADAQAAAALAAYQQTTTRLRHQLTVILTALWRSLKTYRETQMVQFVAQAVPVVAGAQQQMAALTAAYLAQHQSALLGTPFMPAPVDPARVTGAAVRNGTDPGEVYGRPFHLVWRQLADLPREPGSIDQAIQAGLDRAVQTGLTDLQLAKTHTSRQILAGDKRVVGYRRVLEGAHSCALCVLASTQRYHVGKLMPIHPACDCGTAPIYGDGDSGQVIDEGRLKAAYEALAGQPPKDKNAQRWTDHVLVSHEHGELGPVLARKGAPFAGPRDVKPSPRSDANLRRAQVENQRRGEDLLATLRASVEANRNQ